MYRGKRLWPQYVSNQNTCECQAITTGVLLPPGAQGEVAAATQRWVRLPWSEPIDQTREPVIDPARTHAR